MERREIFFGRNLKNIRNMNGVTQEQLAERLHVTRQTISVWESGHGNPDIYMLDDIIEFFGISYEELMHFEKIDFGGYDNIDEIDFGKNVVEIGEPRTYIATIEKPGLYTILEEDVQDFFDVIEIGYEKFMAIVLELHELGYRLTEVFDNGFSVYLHTSEEARKLQKDIYDVIDGFIHANNERAMKNKAIIEAETAKAYLITLGMVEESIFGKSPSEYHYYWIDEMGNPRGYADTKEEIEIQTKEQDCKKYTIIENQ